MLRIGLFLGTNIAVLLVASIAFRLLGLDEYLAGHGLYYSPQGLLVFAAIFGMGGAFVSLAMSKWMARRATGARLVDGTEGRTERWLADTVRRLAREAGVGMPEVAIYDAPDMNAFATGMRRDAAMVAVSTGLLRGMEPEEVEAVLGHELSHVANGDMVTLALVQGVLNTFVIFFSRVIGMVVDRVVFQRDRGYGPGFWIVTIVAQVLLGILASIIVMWFSRWREFRADAGGARLAGRQRMIGALRRLAGHPGRAQLPEQMEAFGISGRGASGLQRLFMSHPPIPERIAALERGA